MLKEQLETRLSTLKQEFEAGNKMLGDLENQRTVLRKQQETLHGQLSALTDPKQIARRAHDQLGLIVPREGQVVMVSLDMNPSPESDTSSPVELVKRFSDSLVSLP